MGRLFRNSLITLVIFFIGTSFCLADTLISNEQTVVTNTLPDITVYAYTDVEYEATVDNIEVYVNDYKTALQSVETFKDNNEGTTYFLLVDVSGSIKQSEFEVIKKCAKKFSRMIEAEDNLYLVPFGESVYIDKTKYKPGASEFDLAVDALSPKDDYTQLYAAIDSVVGLSESESGLQDRKVALIFSDGLDDTTGGLITRDEAISKISEAGIPLYTFAVGKDIEGKNELGTLSRSVNGTLCDLNEANMENVLTEFKRVMDGTLVIKSKVKNSEDIADSFTLRVLRDGEELLVKSNIAAHKNADTKDDFSVTAGKLINKYWWIIAIICILGIIIAALLVIKKNKGVVNIDGKIVYGSRVEKKYHVKIQEYNKKEIHICVQKEDNKAETSKTADFDVEVVESIIVGRSKTCDFSIDDPNISRQHFSIELINKELYLQDLDSTGGTYLNGIKLYEKERIRNGDIIAAGKTKMKIYW